MTDDKFWLEQPILLTRRRVHSSAARRKCGMQTRNLIVNRIVSRELGQVAPRAHGRLLDIGCGTKPWARIFAPHVGAHVGVDHVDSPHYTAAVDLVGTAYHLPVDDATFDTVLCTAVLEHLEEPGAALREARRALHAGGIAIYTVPFFWHLHEQPRDFYRYTRYGIEYLFTQAGFEVVELRPLAGFWVTAGTMFAYYLERWRRGPLKLVIPAIALGVQVVAYSLDRLDKAEEWSWMYLVVAEAR